MALKSFNLEGGRQSGQSLIGNWFEDRSWGRDRQNNLDVLLPTAHGWRLTAQPGMEHKKVMTMSQKVYIPPPEQYEKAMRKSLRKKGAVIYNVFGNFASGSESSLPSVKK
jgi:hypothetical protein